MQSLKLSRQPSNIVRERSTLYFRQIIPKDLRHCWGRSSIKLSLKTGNVVKAKRKAAVMSAMIWDIFTALRKGDGRMTGLSTEELRALANSWLKEILEADEIDRMRGLTAEQRLFWRQEKDDSGMTTKDGVYAGGDAVTGAATVILAMGAGKSAAAAIDEYIQSK